MKALPTTVAMGVIVLVVGLAPRLAATIHAERSLRADGERLYYPAGPLLAHASLGFRAPVADYTWLQAVQYYGGYCRGENDLRYFAGLVDAVVTLDPRFSEAYYFASLVQSLGHGDHDGAIELLKRGILANPADWRLPFNIGFIHYVFLREYQAAAGWFAAAAALPGANDFCQRFAAFSRSRAGDLEGSLLLWDNLRRTTRSPEMRELAERMVEQCRLGLQGAPRAGFVGPPAPPAGAAAAKELL